MSDVQRFHYTMHATSVAEIYVDSIARAQSSNLGLRRNVVYSPPNDSNFFWAL